MGVDLKSQHVGVDRIGGSKSSLLWLFSLFGFGAVILYALGSGLGGVVSLDADRARYEKQRNDDATTLGSLQDEVIRRREETEELSKQAAALRGELQTTASQKLKAVDQTAAAQADLKVANDEYQVELKRLRTVEAEYARLAADLTALKQRSDQAASAATRLGEENSILEERKTKLTADVDGLRTKRDGLVAELKSTNDDLTDVEAKLAEERKKLREKEDEVRKSTTKMQLLAADMTRVEALIAQEQTLKTSIAGLTNSEQSAKQKVDELTAKSAVLKTAVEGLEGQAASTRGMLDQTREITKRVELLLATEAAAIKKTAAAEVELKNAEADAKAALQLKAELPSLQTKKSELEADLKALQTANAATVTAKTALDRETAALRMANDEQVAARGAMKIELEALITRRDAIDKEIERKSQTLKAAGDGSPSAEKPANPTTPEKPNQSP